jgi:hypothetical protein
MNQNKIKTIRINGVKTVIRLPKGMNSKEIPEELKGNGFGTRCFEAGKKEGIDIAKKIIEEIDINKIIELDEKNSPLTYSDYKKFDKRKSNKGLFETHNKILIDEFKDELLKKLEEEK